MSLGPRHTAALHQQYRLCGYTNGRVIGPGKFVGWAGTFTKIFNQRPDGYRFAIAEKLKGEKRTGEFIVWDLFDNALLSAKQQAFLLPPKPKWEGDNEDAMAMKAMMLYDTA